MNEILERLAQHQGTLAEIFTRSGVVLAYLFGSQARGETGPLSEVDIAVLFSPDISKKK